MWTGRDAPGVIVQPKSALQLSERRLAAAHWKIAQKPHDTEKVVGSACNGRSVVLHLFVFDFSCRACWKGNKEAECMVVG